MDTAPILTTTTLRTCEDPHRLLILVPGLGTDVASTWAHVSPKLAPGVLAVGLDLPGHGLSAPWTDAPKAPTMRLLAEAVVDSLERLREQRPSLRGIPARLAGTSLSGGLALELAAFHSDALEATAVIGGLPRFGTAELWQQRAQQVLDDGTAALVEPTLGRWFSPGFRTAAPEAVEAVMASLRAADNASYAVLCSVLSRFDLRTQLSEIRTPVHLVAGELDEVAAPALLREVAETVPDAEFTMVEGVAHQIAVERPRQIAALLSA
ncbi:alpha/beta fold hydrolase [Nesterenkonia xinjiangensis]|uniref:Pimeloyl-ACP methyl ester carboxylesterase n=1 Tax=Nesterenkonia xinjiangensis TaxID=225327 RepID=A0A7Z0KAS5_9MICC|nr:alpha/beta fold hydrolase [Nesterenkonia xinjiangensis]NYJ76912.1 pimeloyl-ACP methyl ester carboxylesterase [Nesterenkonia xinjiangensis]